MLKVLARVFKRKHTAEGRVREESRSQATRTDRGVGVYVSSATKTLRRATSKPRYTTREVFTAVSLAFFERPGRRLAKAFELDRVLETAGMNIHPVKYGAVTISLTVLAALLVITVFTVLALTKPLSPIELVLGLLIALIAPILVFSLRLATPHIRATRRKNEVENELPFFMAYATTMVRGGYSLEKVVERVSQSKVFRAIRNEAGRVITRIRVFGEDPVTAMERVVLNHPSTRFRDIILGYTTTLRSGGDVTHYLEVRTREVFEQRMSEIKSIAGRVLSLLEVYMIFGVIVSLTLFVFFTVSTVISAAQAARALGELRNINIDVTGPALYNFFVLPLMGLLVSIVIDITQPKSPITYLDVYAALTVSVPVSFAALLLMMVATGVMNALARGIRPTDVKVIAYALSITLVSASILPAIKYWQISRRRRGLVRAVASFLRDVCEVRKTGLSPERCIILVSNRDYRSLTPIIERLAVSLQLGLNLEESLRASLRGLKDWFTITSLKFMLDSITVGGGSPEVLDTLARFVQILSELEEEVRKRMKSQIVLPYLGAALMAFSPLVLLYMLTSLARIPVAAMTPLILVLSLGCLVNSYIMGLVAGKATETTMAAGFKHAIALTTATTLALAFAFSYIGL